MTLYEKHGNRSSMIARTSTGGFFIQFFIRVKQFGDILSRFRAVFGYDGKTNDLKVVETGGMYYGSFVAFDMIYLNLKCYCSFITLNVMG